MKFPLIAGITAAWLLAPAGIAASIELTLHDAQRLVERTPAFVEAQQNGYCPQSGGDATVRSGHAYLVVRGECKGSSVIGNFDVDLVSGLMRDGIADRPVETPALEQLRTELLRAQRDDSGSSCPARATERLKQDVRVAHNKPTLTVEEAEALARALKGSDPASANCTRVNHESGHNADDAWLQIETGCRGEDKVTRIVVDLLTGSIRELLTGSILDSPAEAQLRKALLARAAARKAEAAERVSKQCGK